VSVAVINRSNRPRLDPYVRRVGLVTVLGSVMSVLDTTIVNVALDSLATDLHTTISTIQWVVTGYLLALAATVPISAWAARRIGIKRLYLLSLIVFTLGSALCGLAWSAGSLIFFRVLQGVGGGLIMPVGQMIIVRTAGKENLGRVMGVLSTPTVIAPVIGPTVGGILLQNFGWEWIFLINVPIGIVAFFFGWKNLRDHKEKTVGSFDLPGFLLSAGALSLIVFALSDGPEAGWASPPVLITAVVGVICAFAMVYAELHIRYPMLDLRLLIDNRLFRMCNIVGLISMASFLGLTFVMPLYLQLLRGQNALTSGLTTFPQAFGIMISSLVAGRIYRRIGPRRLMAGGLFAAGLTIATFTQIGLDTSLWTIRILMFLRGLCMGYAFVPMQAASYATIKPADTGRASSIFSTQRQIGVSLGVAILASILTAHMSLDTVLNPSDPTTRAVVNEALTGFHWAFAAAVGFAFLAAFAALFIRDSEAEGTMHPKHT
jgi:EmrB/QacA subfamily drug resistance transporter